MSIALWIVQVLLAAVFLFAGYAKLAMPAEEIATASPLPVWFNQFIAVCEIIGAVGLVLPGLLRIRTGLTPLAAASLTIIMIGAVVTTVAFLPAMAAFAVIPAVIGLLTAFVAYGRWKLAPQRDRAATREAARA
jgi:uncharacterized membrane protein YphA (DoxX/SURF4 family)